MHDKSPESQGPLHIAKCAAELGILAVKELGQSMSDAIDNAWPDDDPEDQAITSGRWHGA